MRTHILDASGRQSSSMAALMPAVTPSGPSPPPDAYSDLSCSFMVGTDEVKGNDLVMYELRAG